MVSQQFPSEGLHGVDSIMGEEKELLGRLENGKHVKVAQDSKVAFEGYLQAFHSK